MASSGDFTTGSTIGSTSTDLPVVCGVDGSPLSDQALDWAIAEARRRSLPLHIVHGRGIPFGDPRLLATYIEQEPPRTTSVGLALDRVAEVAPELEVTSEEPWTTSARSLLRASETAECVVVGAAGHRALSGVLGSTSMQVATHADSPVVVVRGEGREIPPSAPVVVGIDGSASATSAIRFALREASERDLGLSAVHASWLAVTDSAMASGMARAWEEVRAEQRERAFDALADARKDFPRVTVRETVVSAHPVEALVAASEGASLLVVGSRGRGGFAGLLLGSVGQGVLHRSAAPVAIVRPR